MAKHKNKISDIDTAAHRLVRPVALLKERLEPLSIDQLVEILQKFLAQLSEEQQRNFIRLLPTAPVQDPESRLAYPSDKDFLETIKNFCARVRNQEFVQEGAWFDPVERAYHGFGDDSWIDEMDALFEAAELYFLARHYGTAEAAYRLLLDCLRMQGDGDYYFTTADPQGALVTDVMRACQRYFESLCHLYTDESLAEKIIEGLQQYRYLGEQPLDLKELFPQGGEAIRLLEGALVKRSAHEEPDTMKAWQSRNAEYLRQVYMYFRNLEELERFAKQHGRKHPWAYEVLVQAYVEQNHWQKVLFWASQGLSNKANKRVQRRAFLADCQAKAAEQLGDPALLPALWEALASEATVERYVALRNAAKGLGRWNEYYPRLIRQLTHNVSGDSISTDDLQDNRLLTEALLVEGDYERALERATQPKNPCFWDEKADARKSVLHFFLHSVTRTLLPDACAEQFPEIARRLDQPPEFIKLLKEELFQTNLPEADRDQQIDWMVQVARPRIDAMALSKVQSVEAAWEAKLVEELYRFQGRGDKARSFIAEINAQYRRRRNFRAELKRLGVGV